MIMKERIQKILSARGVASRRQAENMILAGRVACNGVICTIGDCADPEFDVIMVDGVVIPSVERKVYIMLHKPRGYVTTLSDEKGRKNAAQLVQDCGLRVYPVGRLDMDSEGLLLFTNDGEFANHLMHPKHNIDKVYIVNVNGYSEDALQKLRQPILLDGYQIKQPGVLVKIAEGDRAQLEIIIHEGRNRQIRRMCAAAGMRVVRLKRIKEGNVQLGTLPSGKWRHLTPEEVSSLYN